MSHTEVRQPKGRKDYVGDIPFSRAGDQQHYPEFNVVWRPNASFHDTLTFTSFQRGRSAAYAEFTRKSNGCTVVVFLTDLAAMLPRMIMGEIEETFTFCKRGANYGCRLSKEA